MSKRMIWRYPTAVFEYKLMKILAVFRILEGKRAVIYGKPFNSSSVLARNLTAEIIYNRAGVRLEYRPLEQLESLFETVDPAGAKKEMERWKKSATLRQA
jgi:hypothetical protein